jgi:hypothetical protein
LKREEKVEVPGLYCTATDRETLEDALHLGARIIGGQIFGAAGLLIGLAKLRNMKGFCILADTPGFYPDATATREALKTVCQILNLKVDLRKLDTAMEATRNILKSFGLISSLTEEKKKESEFRGLI